MRVLFVNPNRSAVYGGVERWMMDAAAGLGARGHHCVLVGRPGASWVRAARRAGLAVRGDHRGPWAMRAVRFAAAMGRVRPDVVVVKGKKAARMAAFGQRVTGCGAVTLLFGLTHELRARRWLDRATWGRVDAGIVFAHRAAAWYVERGFGPRTKLHVLWKGVDVATFDVPPDRVRAARAALGLAPADLAVGTVGRLAWQKGLAELCAAAPRVRARHPGTRFFIVGGGRDEPRVRAAARGTNGAVAVLGARDDVPGLMAAFDVVAQPSQREVMAQTTLEAMAAGRPVVSTRTVGADEAIEDGVSGVLVPVGDVAALADALADLLGDPRRRAALGTAARERVRATFTMDRMVDRCEALLAGIASGG